MISRFILFFKKEKYLNIIFPSQKLKSVEFGKCKGQAVQNDSKDRGKWVYLEDCECEVYYGESGECYNCGHDQSSHTPLFPPKESPKPQSEPEDVLTISPEGT